MWKKVISLIVSVSLAFSVSINYRANDTQAATFADITADNVFLKQKTAETCTACAAAMMLRRAAILRGDSNWKSITESSVKSVAWADGLFWDFTYSKFNVVHGNLTGSASSKKSKLINLLKEHPEGIVLYYSGGSKQHAVLLTHYEDGVFYCSDPDWGKPDGIIPLNKSLYVTAENAQYYWYIPSAKLKVEEPKVQDVVIDGADGDSLTEDLVNSVGGKLLANSNILYPYNYVENIKKMSVKKLKLKAGKKAVTVSWNSVKGASGYKITYSTNSSFKKAKSVTVSKKKDSVSIKKLKSKKVYYVKIRAYEKVKSGKKTKKVFYPYSKVKKIKTK